jgi:hypothetical protein
VAEAQSVGRGTPDCQHDPQEESGIRATVDLTASCPTGFFPWRPREKHRTTQARVQPCHPRSRHGRRVPGPQGGEPATSRPGPCHPLTFHGNFLGRRASSRWVRAAGGESDRGVAGSLSRRAV